MHIRRRTPYRGRRWPPIAGSTISHISSASATHCAASRPAKYSWSGGQRWWIEPSHEPPTGRRLADREQKLVRPFLERQEHRVRVGIEKSERRRIAIRHAVATRVERTTVEIDDDVVAIADPHFPHDVPIGHDRVPRENDLGGRRPRRRTIGQRLLALGTRILPVAPDHDDPLA